MAGYRFVTVWKLRAPIDAVWQAIVRAEEWPSWWQGVVDVQLLREGDERGIGSVRRYKWKSKLPYTLAFDMEVVESKPPELLAGRAGGELSGTGTWQLSQREGVTTATFTWAVKTKRPWMNLLAPLARPLFVWNHDYIMKKGGEGLARLLGAELVSA